MNLHHWIQLFIEQIQETSIWVWAAVIFSVAEVLLAKVNNIWLYPTGIAGTLLGIYVLLTAHLYAESILNGYYIVMSVYGWYYWIKKRNEPPVKITIATRREWVITLIIVFVGWGLFYVVNFLPAWFNISYTQSNVPIWDSWVASTAWAGMWLLARRKLENWVLLNISNLFAIPLLFYKQLPMFGLLTLFLFIVAIFGFFQWLRIWKNENQKVSPTGGDLERVEGATS
ncbi:MAG: nicotinamide riboside transporter PnuC [Bacteroidota bacterium]